jgi:uncharacterized membrane protein YeaQ/YmgE (transglycosylase-associated protein family)
MSATATKDKAPFNRKHIWALIMAIFQLNIFALIVGHFALKTIKEERSRGRGVTVVANILAGIQTAFLAWFIVDPSGLPFTLGYLYEFLLNG